MKYRDHMNLGALIYIPFLSKAYLGKLPECFMILLPFFKVFLHNESWIPGAAAYFFFSIGCCLPDIDVSWYPEGGHRIKSPLHNLTNILILYAVSVFLCMIPAGSKLLLVFSMISALLFGCLAHLAGDFIQGGVGWGIKRKKKIGFKGFKWDIYINTMKGSSMSIFIAVLTFAVWWWLFNRHACLAGPAAYAVIASAVIWLYSIVACRSYSRYLGNAITAILLFVLAAALKPGLIGL